MGLFNIVAVLSVIWAFYAHGNAAKVQTTSGLAEGSTLADGHAFYEIPYAVPPVGNLRFQDPVPLSNSSNVIDATYNDYTVCYQIWKPCYGGACYTNLTEDCLVLNVFVPLDVDLSNSSSPPQERLPVLFFIHGGFFYVGSGTEDKNNGQGLSNATNSIVVTINYRLGIFGFLVYGEEENAFAGNQGLKDQRLAMKWVQDNIGNFGGDNTRVTIFGSSAGSQSIAFHLVSSKSDPFFHRAILESWAHVPYYDRSGSLTTTGYVLSALNCTGDAIGCLLNASPEELISVGPLVMALQELEGGIGYIEPFRPFIDGSEIKDQPINMIQRGEWQIEKPLILGTALEEVPAAFSTQINSSAQFVALNVKRLGEEVGSAAAERYEQMMQDERFDYTAAWALEQTHFLFACPSRAMARFASNSSKEHKIYLYGSNYIPDGPACKEVYLYNAGCGKPFHTSELPVVFRSGPLFGYTFNANDIAAADQFSTYWGSFASTGDPSSGLEVPLRDVTDWPKYVKDSWQNMQIQAPKEAVVENYLGDICDFWDSLDYYAVIDDGAVTGTGSVVLTSVLAVAAFVCGQW